MKYIMEFNLPEEKEDFEYAQKGVGYAMVIHDLDDFLRGEIKYKDREELQEIRDKLWEFMRDRGLDL